MQDELTTERKRVASLREDLAVQQEKLKVKEQSITELKKQNNQLEEQYFAARLQNLQDFAEYYEEKKALKSELEANLTAGIKEIERLEQKLLTLNKKKLQMQAQLNQAELKNTQLELKAIGLENQEISDFSPGLTYFKYAVYALLAI